RGYQIVEFKRVKKRQQINYFLNKFPEIYKHYHDYFTGLNGFYPSYFKSINLPLMGVKELFKFANIWVYMLGAGKASKERLNYFVGFIEVFVNNPKVISILNCIK